MEPTWWKHCYLRSLLMSEGVQRATVFLTHILGERRPRSSTMKLTLMRIELEEEVGSRQLRLTPSFLRQRLDSREWNFSRTVFFFSLAPPPPTQLLMQCGGAKCNHGNAGLSVHQDLPTNDGILWIFIWPKGWILMFWRPLTFPSCAPLGSERQQIHAPRQMNRFDLSDLMTFPLAPLVIILSYDGQISFDSYW